MQEDVPVCSELVLLGALRKAQALELVPGTSSRVAAVCVLSDLLAVVGAVNAFGRLLQLFLWNDVPGVVEEGPLREAGRARLGMPDEVVLDGLLAGVALARQRLAHTGTLSLIIHLITRQMMMDTMKRETSMSTFRQ